MECPREVGSSTAIDMRNDAFSPGIVTADTAGCTSIEDFAPPGSLLSRNHYSRQYEKYQTVRLPVSSLPVGTGSTAADCVDVPVDVGISDHVPTIDDDWVGQSRPRDVFERVVCGDEDESVGIDPGQL